MESKFKRIVSIVITIAVIMTMTVTPGFAQDAAGEEIIPEDTVTYTYSQEVGEDEAGYNDELFEKYVEAQLFSGIEDYSTEKAMLRSVNLSDMNQMIFDRLKEQISEVAAGNSTSTVFTVSLDDLGISGASWTAAELGVSSSATTNELFDALMSKLGIDLSRVYDALIAECAYELYWHDKSREKAFSMSSPGLARSGSGSSMRISMSGVFTFRFQVAEAYSAGEYTVNTENIDRVHTAVENANATVSKAAILTDDEKLTLYKSEICGLVTYDTAAAEDDSTPYGDQWQLISVFDGDDTTNVVCEGYSKAFKYLCDLTEFDDPGIGCILVSGTMRGATGAGAHMWNIVTINGENYLVDVTNCDDGTIGAPDQLFLKGNENGSVTDGYTFTCEGGNVSYAYGEETMSLYEEELELAKADYSGNEEGEVEKYVESMEFEAMPRLRKDVDASLSATAFDGDTVTLNYSDGSSEVYVLKNWNFISQTTETTTDESARISISYDDQNHVDFASYNNGDIRLRADDPGASYVAQSMELTSSGPVELIRGLDSVTKTDASGNEYEEYNLERLGRYNKFLENDSFKVTYKNGLDEEITVGYVYTDSTGGFTLAEDNPYYTGYPSDNYFGTYFEVELPDQSVDHFEVGQTYNMDVTYNEKGSNFELTPITTAGKPYSLKITQAGPEDVTSISFTDDIVYSMKKGETADLSSKVEWEPEYAVVTVEWSSSKPSVASVDENGTLTALSGGFTEITAKIGEKKVSYTLEVIEEKILSDETVSLSQTVFPYTGNNVDINQYVLYNGTLVPHSNLSTQYSERPLNIGDYTATITGVYGGYSGSATKSFTIKGDLSRSATNVSVTLDSEEYVYEGSPVEPEVVSITAVGKGGGTATLTEETDYTVSYMDNNAAGTGYVVITAVDDSYYMGAKRIPFTITEPGGAITAAYERETPFEVVMERDFKDYGNGPQYVGESFDYPDAGDKVTFTFPDGTVKVYEYQKSGSSSGKFVNTTDSTDVITNSNIQINILAQAYDWEPGGDKNYYEVSFINYPEDGNSVTCQVPVEVSSTPVASIEYEPVPVLLWADDAGRSGMPAGSKVTVTYKDGTSEVFLDDYETHSWISQKTGEPLPANENLYYQIWVEQNREDLSCTASYMGVTSEKNYGALYVAQSISLHQEEPMELIRGKDSTTMTDAEGNAYENYSLYKYYWFGGKDVLTVTYKNGLNETIDVDYASHNDTSFKIPETSSYSSGYPDDIISGNYITIHMPDQSKDHFEVGKTYSMDLTFQEVGSNFKYPAFTTEGEPYKVLITQAGPEDVTSISFANSNVEKVKKGETLQLGVNWEPSYAVVPEGAMTWTSSNPAVATVDGNGLVTAVSEGSVLITAEINGKKAYKNVEVYDEKVLTDETVSLAQTVFPYTGINVDINQYVLYNGKLVPNSYLSTQYSERPLNIGDYTATITGVYGGYSGSATKSFTIKGNLAGTAGSPTVTLDPADGYVYSGEPVKPTVASVKFNGTTLTEGKDYTVSYENNNSAGTGYVVITAVDDSYYMGAKLIPFTITEPEPEEPVVVIEEVERIYGASRFDTALKVADELKERTGKEKYDAVILAFSHNYADALAGSYLSCAINAPILLVNSKQDNIDSVQSYIKENLAPGGTIYMLGGTAVVPEAAVKGLTGFNTKRLWGKDRYETNVAILKEAAQFTNDTEIIVASGNGFADSLSAAATGKPILLVKNTLQPVQKEYLNSLEGDLVFDIIGGTGAVSDAVMKELNAYGSANRTGGATRYETSVNVAKKFFDDPEVGVLAYGQDFPDGLCGGALAHAFGGPLILTANGRTDAAVEYANETGMKFGAVLGGPTLISDASAKDIYNMGSNDKIEVK